MTLAKRLIYMLLMDKRLGDGLTGQELRNYVNQISDPKISEDAFNSIIASMYLHRNIVGDTKTKKWRLTESGIQVYNLITSNDIGRYLLSKIEGIKVASAEPVSESKIDDEGTDESDICTVS